jgi:hypothetical protein
VATRGTARERPSLRSGAAHSPRPFGPELFQGEADIGHRAGADAGPGGDSAR